MITRIAISAAGLIAFTGASAQLSPQQPGRPGIEAPPIEFPNVPPGVDTFRIDPSSGITPGRMPSSEIWQRLQQFCSRTQCTIDVTTAPAQTQKGATTPPDDKCTMAKCTENAASSPGEDYGVITYPKKMTSVPGQEGLERRKKSLNDAMADDGTTPKSTATPPQKKEPKEPREPRDPKVPKDN